MLTTSDHRRPNSTPVLRPTPADDWLLVRGVLRRLTWLLFLTASLGLFAWLAATTRLNDQVFGGFVAVVLFGFLLTFAADRVLS